MRIAIVDDLAAERALLKDRLEQQLHRRNVQADILEYESGETFLEAARKAPFTAAFLDIYMDGMTGMEAAKKLRKTNTDCLLVFTTTSTDHALEGFQVRALHYLVKPFTEADIDALTDELLARIPQPDKYMELKSFTVGSWLEVWMENYAKIKLGPSTFKTLQGFLKNHIKPQIGSIPLAELTSLDLQKFYKHLLEGGRVDRIEAKKKPKGLAPKTVRNIHQMICSAYNLAMEQKLVNKNPTQGCALPKVEHKEMKTLTADQLSAFFREAKETGVYELYYLDLATGLRRGELLGLKWTDIDFDRGVLKIQRAISRQNGRVEEAPLKTKNAYRTLPLSADAIDVLKAQKNKVGSSEWVFPSPTGGPMSPDSVLHMLQRVLKRAGLPRIRFHDLRHTFATMALQNGVDVKTLSSMLGHYSAGFTLDTYAHVTTDAQLKAAQTMGNILSSAI